MGGQGTGGSGSEAGWEPDPAERRTWTASETFGGGGRSSMGMEPWVPAREEMGR